MINHIINQKPKPLNLELVKAYIQIYIRILYTIKLQSINPKSSQQTTGKRWSDGGSRTMEASRFKG